MPVADTPRAVRATIVVPSFNHAAWVVEAVQSALAQTERDLEVLVIDDGSTDDSLARLAQLSDPRLEVVAQENVG
ncbi:MAG: glycosyltransferase family 2 protein, partial [Deltaproteobacteria bacterium]|nr:glycosyltransferase family 2 protein [Deltaproteobacteria bacterium]